MVRPLHLAVGGVIRIAAPRLDEGHQLPVAEPVGAAPRSRRHLQVADFDCAGHSGTGRRVESRGSEPTRRRTRFRVVWWRKLSCDSVIPNSVRSPFVPQKPITWLRPDSDTGAVGRRVQKSLPLAVLRGKADSMVERVSKSPAMVRAAVLGESGRRCGPRIPANSPSTQADSRLFQTDRGVTHLGLGLAYRSDGCIVGASLKSVCKRSRGRSVAASCRWRSCACKAQIVILRVIIDRPIS